MVVSATDTPRTLHIENLLNGSFRAKHVGAEGDLDGDGVIDGESLSGSEGKVVNAGGLNQILAQHGVSGLQASGSEITSDDGFAVTPGNAPVVINYGGDPVLPSVRGAAAKPDDLSGNLHWADDMGAGALMWLAMSEMAKLAQRDMIDAKKIMRANQQGKIQAKMGEINAAEERIAAETDAAATTMVTNLVAVGVTIALGAWGTTGTAAGGVGAAAAQSVGQAINSTSTYISKSGGAQKEADEKRLEEMRWGITQEIFDQGLEEARGSHEEAKKEFERTLRILIENAELRTQVIQKITS